MIVCMRYAKNLEEAEEILQDGFMRVFTFIGQFKQEGSFEGWIRKIMVNCALQKLRNHINLKPVFSLDADLHTHPYSNDIVESISGKEMLKLVQALSPAYRMVFNLYYFEGMKHREIAELLHIEEGTSKSNLAQAKRILQNAVTQHLKIAK
jgi:RNA polymerase sigma factor (sigma-70 family)